MAVIGAIDKAYEKKEIKKLHAQQRLRAMMRQNFLILMYVSNNKSKQFFEASFCLLKSIFCLKLLSIILAL